MGGLAETHAHPREILRPVILAGAYGFAVIHNHPSGDPSPSRADEMMTRRLVDASAIMQVRMIDHVIAADEPMRGRPRYYSFREAGMIP
jgi:DNA repair protein RadC